MAPKKSSKNPGILTAEVSKSKNDSFKKMKKESGKSVSKNEQAVLDFANIDAAPLTRGAMKRINLKDSIKPGPSKQTSKQNATKRTVITPVKLVTEKKKRTARNESTQTGLDVNATGNSAIEVEIREMPKTNDKRKRKSDVVIRSAEMNKKLRPRTDIESTSENIQTNCSQSTMLLPIEDKKSTELIDNELHGVNKLPSEVLTEIFSYLPFRDLKNARLVCRGWYDAANVMQFLLDEKLLCYALYDLNVIIETLMNSKRKTLNLEFYDFKFENYPITFWEKCSQKIGSLLFSDCFLPEETIEKIIIHCDKLECLSLENMPPEYNSEKFCSEDMLLRLVDAGVVRKNVTFLDLNMLETGWVSNSLLKSLFTIFPCIKKFLFYCDTVEDDFNTGDINDEDLLNSNVKCTFSSILKMITDSINVLDELAVDLGDYRSLDSVPAAAVCEAIMPLSFTRLVDIKIDIDLVSMPQTRVIEFFARHRKLESVECQILFEDTAEFTSQLLTCLLDSCPNLRYLQLFQDVILYRTVDISPTLFSKLANSRLESLSFNFGLNVTAPEVLPVNNTLLSLSLFSAIDKDVHSIFYRTFRNLKHLEVSSIDDETLATCFKYQTELTSLKLIDCHNCSDFGFTGHSTDPDQGDNSDCSMRRLKKLEYLELKMYAPLSRITNATFTEFIFPNLKYLHVTVEGIWEFHTDLVNTFHNFPLLEGIYLMADRFVEYSNWLLLCNNLKRLRYLHIDNREGGEILREAAYEATFECCPSLRAFKHRNNNMYVSYYYDTIQKKIAMKTSDREQYRISAEDIDTFSVNWMWF